VHAKSGSASPKQFFATSTATFTLGVTGAAGLRGHGAIARTAFKLADLVAHESSLFEFEVVGGLKHFLFEFADGLGDVEILASIAQDGDGFFVVLRFGEAFLDGARDAARSDVVFLIVGELLRAAVLGGGEEILDALSQDISVENHFPVQMARSAARSLDQTRGGTEVAFLVGIENGDEGDFGKIETFAKEVNADEDVELAFAKGTENFDALDGVDLAVEITNIDADIAEVISEFLGGSLGERRDEDALLPFDTGAGLVDEIVDLTLEGFHRDHRIDKAGGTNDLFGDAADSPLEFLGLGSGADVDGLILPALEFLEVQGAIVEGAGKAKAMLDENCFARAITGKHAANLRDGGV
jgi:hypothetical protein